MASEYKDVLRVEVTGTPGETGLSDILRNKQAGFERLGTHRMGHKRSDGTMDYWTPDGCIEATGINYSHTDYPAVGNVQDALDQAFAGLTGMQQSSSWAEGLVDKGTTGIMVYVDDQEFNFTNTATTERLSMSGITGSSDGIHIASYYGGYKNLYVDANAIIINSAIAPSGNLIVEGALGVTGGEIKLQEHADYFHIAGVTGAGSGPGATGIVYWTRTGNVMHVTLETAWGYSESNELRLHVPNDLLPGGTYSAAAPNQYITVFDGGLALGGRLEIHPTDPNDWRIWKLDSTTFTDDVDGKGVQMAQISYRKTQ